MRTTFSTWALAASSFLFSPTFAAYNLKDNYSPANFFSMFDFFTDSDPTDGYVDYQSQSAAQAASLISTANNQIYMGVDSTSMGSGRGRKSVRVTSKAVYNHALIILDLQHMPGSICGVWPAFWTVGPNWPSSGEIDIIEGVNSQSSNAMTLHTGPGCSIAGPLNSGGSAAQGGTSSSQGILFSGSVSTSNCDINAAGQAQNAGCGITTGNQASYGDGFNAGQGGVYATEWLSTGVSIWYFPRSMIPNDIASGSPNPANWGTPVAHFGGSSCSFDSSFKNQQIVFDTTFCGQWAGTVWSNDATCSKKAATCQDFVQNNPSAFKEAFWTINSLKVYTSDGSAAAPSVNSIAPQPSTNAIASAVSSKPAVFGSSTGAPVPLSAASGKPSAPPASASQQPQQPQSQQQPTTTKPNGAPTGGQPWNGQSWSQGGGGGGNTQWTHQSGHRSQAASSGANGAVPVLPTNSISVAAAAITPASSSTSSAADQPYAVVVGPSGVVMEQPVDTVAAFANPSAVHDVSATIIPPLTPTSSDIVSIPTSYDVVDPQFTVPSSHISSIAATVSAEANMNTTVTTTLMTLTQSNPSPLVSLSAMTGTATTTAVLPWETWVRRRRENGNANGSMQAGKREEVEMEMEAVHAHMSHHRHREHQQRSEHGHRVAAAAVAVPGHWASRRRR